MKYHWTENGILGLKGFHIKKRLKKGKLPFKDTNFLELDVHCRNMDPKSHLSVKTLCSLEGTA